LRCLMLISGKAIDFGGSAEVPLETLIQDGYEGGVEEPLVVPFKEFQIITIPVWGLLRSGEETVAYDFTLEYDSKVLQFIQADSALLSDWGGDFWDVRHTDGNKVSVAHATLNYKNSLKGKLQNGETGDRGYRLATVTFKVVNPDPTTVDNVDVSKFVHFSSTNGLQIYNFGDGANLVSGKLLQPSGTAGCSQTKCSFSALSESEIKAGIIPSNADKYITGDDMAMLCLQPAFVSYCTKTGTSGVATFDVDLDGDGSVGASDAQVVFGVDGARLKKDCGAGGKDTSKNPCNIAGVYFCDDGSFRLSADYKSESCPFNPARVKK